MNIIDLAQYKYTLKLDSKEYTANMKQAEKQADLMKNKIESVGKSVRNTLVGALAIASTATVLFAKKGIGLASNLEEVQNVVDVTFGDGADKINKWSKSAGDAFGISELQAKKFTGTMGAMLKSMGLTDVAVMDMSTSITGLAGDLASFYNLDTEEAFNKIRSGISGETEPLKQLGINMSVANLEAYALAEGIKTAYSEMTQAGQATLRYNYLLKVTKDAQGDFAKTSDSFANQQRKLSLEIETLSASFGEKLLPQLNSLMPKAISFVKNLDLSKITNALSFILTNGGAIASTAVGIGAGMMTRNVATLVMSLVQSIKIWTGATKTAAVAQTGLNAAMASNPIGLVITVLAALTAGLLSYKMMVGDATSASKELYKETKKLTEEYENNKKAIDNSKSADLGKVEASEKLTDELYNLNEQVKNGTLSEEDAIDAKQRMHNIADELRRLMPDVRLEFSKETGTLITQRGEVDLLSESYRKLALSKAYAAKLDEAYTKIADANLKAQQAEEKKGAEQYNIDYYAMSGGKTYREATKNLKNLNATIEDAANIRAIAEKDIEDINNLIKEQGVTIAGTKNTVKDLGDVFKSTGKASKKATKDTNKAEKELTKQLEEERDKRFTDLKYNLDMEYITESEYYKGIEKLRDTYFAEGTYEWQKYSLDIYNFQKKTFEDMQKDIKETFSKITDSAKAEYAEIEQARSNLEGKLKGYANLFEKTQIRIKNWKDGETLEITKNELGNLKEANSQLTNYRDLLNAVKARGAGEELFSLLRDMSPSEAMENANTLLKVTDDEFNTFINDLKSNRELTKDISENFYADEVTAIENKYVNELTNSLGGLVSEYSSMGEQYANAIGSGFVNAISEVSTKIKEAFFNNTSGLGIGLGNAVNGGLSLPQLNVASVGGYGNYNPMPVNNNTASTTNNDNGITLNNPTFSFTSQEPMNGTEFIRELRSIVRVTGAR